MNIVALSGRLAADVRDHYTKAGKHVVHFPLAVQKSFIKDEEGKYPVNYFQIELWNKVADSCAAHLLRGDRVNVQGYLDTESYRGDDGKTNYQTKVVATNVEFLTPKNRDESSSTQSADEESAAAAAEERSELSGEQLRDVPAETSPSPRIFSDVPDEEIPF